MSKKIKTSSRGRLRGHQERKIIIKDDLINNSENSNLFSSAINSFKNNGSENQSLKEIEKLEAIENSQLIKSVRKEKILLNKFYLNKVCYASAAM